MTCDRCGAPVADGYRFCPECGAPVPGAEPTNPTPGGAVPAAAIVGVRGLVRRTKALLVMLWVAIGLSAMNAVSFGADPETSGGTDMPMSSREEALAGLVALIVTALSLAAPILWLLWQRHAQSNLVALGMRDLRFTPGWALGWWLIPLANLVMPYRTVKELLTRSAGASEIPPWFAAWWGCFVGSTLLITYGTTLASATDPSVVDQGYQAMAVGGAVHVVAGLLALRLVRRVLQGQLALIGNAT